MSKSSREYIREYQRQYRIRRQCRGHDHVPTVAPQVDEVGYPEPPTQDEITGAKQALLAMHRLRAIGVRR
jgi:hypothetical protein